MLGFAFNLSYTSHCNGSPHILKPVEGFFGCNFPWHPHTWSRPTTLSALQTASFLTSAFASAFVYSHPPVLWIALAAPLLTNCLPFRGGTPPNCYHKAQGAFFACGIEVAIGCSLCRHGTCIALLEGRDNILIYMDVNTNSNGGPAHGKGRVPIFHGSGWAKNWSYD